eukprot:294060_1
MAQQTINFNPGPYGQNKPQQVDPQYFQPPSQDQNAPTSKREQYVNASMNPNAQDNAPQNFASPQPMNNQANDNFVPSQPQQRQPPQKQQPIPQQHQQPPQQQPQQQQQNNYAQNNPNMNAMGGNNNNMNRSSAQFAISCDDDGSTSVNTRERIQAAIEHVLADGQATNPESISVALRNVGFMALLFSGGHGFWWNFECEWSEWSWDGGVSRESYRIIVWKPSQNN